METPNSQLAGRSTEGLGLAVGIRSGEQSYETEPLSCGVCTNATKLSVRIKINCRTPTCCLASWRIGSCGVKSPTHLVSEVVLENSSKLVSEVL